MILDCEQRTEEWKALRCGRVTASRVADVMAELKSGKGEAATRRNYKAEIIAEILTGVSTEGFVSKEMQWGTDTEPFARAAYEMESDSAIDIIGFATHPLIERFGASPDGIIGEDGLVEIKCPNTATHIDYILAGVVPADYQLQMLAQMNCTGRIWCDFISFDPRLPKHLQLFVRRFHYDRPRAELMLDAVEKFLNEVDDVISRLEIAVPVQEDIR